MVNFPTMKVMEDENDDDNLVVDSVSFAVHSVRMHGTVPSNVNELTGKNEGTVDSVVVVPRK